MEKLAEALGVEYKTLFENSLNSEALNSIEFSKNLLETKLIMAITDTIHQEVKS